MDTRLIQAALYEIEPNTGYWHYLIPLVSEAHNDTDKIIAAYLKKADMRGSFPKEVFTYTVKFFGTKKLVVVDTRKAEGLAADIDEIFHPVYEGSDEDELDPDYLT